LAAFTAKLPPLRNFRLTAWGRYGAAALAGVCLALAFPKTSIAGLAWIAPALFVAVALGTRGWQTFRIGYIAGLAHYLVSLSWLLHIPVRGYPILGWIALSAFLALFQATWVWLMLEVQGSRFRVQSPDASDASDNSTWAQRSLWALAGAASWVALEMLLARVFGGFPWNLLGASQYQLLPLIQIASITGVYGVSFLVVWVSLALFNAVGAIFRQPANRHAWLGEVILPATALAIVFALGMRTLREPAETSSELRVTMIQPSIPQTMIWDAQENSNRFRQLIEQTQSAFASTRRGVARTNGPLTRPSDTLSPSDWERDGVRGSGTDLVLWPEAAVPEKLRFDEATQIAVTNLARSNDVWLILGSDDGALRPGGTTEADVDYFNASFLVSPRGEVVAGYRKRHLVMFGEFIPFARWLPFVKWFTPITGGFEPGTRVVPFRLERRAPPRHEVDAAAARAEAVLGAPIHTATLICFEDVFPHLVREYVEDDTDFLVNLTNDGWFGESAAQWQHAATAVFRAVENGVPLLRCCNNGLSCVVDKRGRIREVLRDANGGVYGPGVLSVALPLRSAETRPLPTFYNRHGDWFGWGCVGLAVLMVLARFRRSHEKQGA
jgi:apolipoprotein N-acyltransferase